MRNLLDATYLWSGYLASVFMVAIGLTIGGQVVGRQIGITFDATEISGFCLAAATFLGLGYTFHRGSHIRVTLLIHNFPVNLRRVTELWCCGSSAVILGYISFYAVGLVIQSYNFNEKSQSLIAVPMWIPQLGMAVGLIILTIGMVDEFVGIFRGAVPNYEANAESVLDAPEQAGST